MAGETNSLMPALVGSGENAALGAVSALELVVIQPDCALLAEVVQPDGRPGALTPSKVSWNTCVGWPAISAASNSWSCCKAFNKIRDSRQCTSDLTKIISKNCATLLALYRKPAHRALLGWF